MPPVSSYEQPFSNYAKIALSALENSSSSILASDSDLTTSNILLIAVSAESKIFGISLKITNYLRIFVTYRLLQNFPKNILICREIRRKARLRDRRTCTSNRFGIMPKFWVIIASNATENDFNSILTMNLDSKVSETIPVAVSNKLKIFECAFTPIFDRFKICPQTHSTKNRTVRPASSYERSFSSYDQISDQSWLKYLRK